MFWKRTPTDAKRLHRLEAKVQSLEKEVTDIKKVQSHILDLIVGLDNMIKKWKEGIR